MYVPLGGGPGFGVACEHRRPIFETDEEEPPKFLGVFKRLVVTPVTEEAGVVAFEFVVGGTIDFCDVGVAGGGCIANSVGAFAASFVFLSFVSLILLIFFKTLLLQFHKKKNR